MRIRAIGLAGVGVLTHLLGAPRIAPRLADVPVDPTPDEARSWLRRELLAPEYHQDNLLSRILDWVDRAFGNTVGAAAEHSWLSMLAAMVVLALLALAVAWLVSRGRRTERLPRRREAVLADEAITADELRARARAALAAGEYATALVDGYRALATRQVERGRLVASPGLTAHEVALSLVAEFPDQAAAITQAAGRFDDVRYGERGATAAQAEAVLALESTLAGPR